VKTRKGEGNCRTRENKEMEGYGWVMIEEKKEGKGKEGSRGLSGRILQNPRFVTAGLEDTLAMAHMEMFR